jgi:hypothetical protein
MMGRWHLGLSLALLCLQAAAADEVACHGLYSRFSATTSTHRGKQVELLDFSGHLAANNRYKNFKGKKIVSLKDIFENWKDETFISISDDGHVALISHGVRYDGRIAYLTPITVEESTPLVQSGLIIRLKTDPAVRDTVLKELVEAMGKLKGTRSLTCVRGLCQLATGAHVKTPWMLGPGSLFAHILKTELNWKGEPIQVQFITTEPRTVQDYQNLWSLRGMFAMKFNDWVTRPLSQLTTFVVKGLKDVVMGFLPK